MRLVFLLFFALFSITSNAEIIPIQGQLANGLNYIILPYSQDKGRIEIRAKVNVGAIDQTDQQHGVAHMLEHMVFRASQTYPQGIMDYLHQTGWQRGRHYNAVTNAESTTYMLLPPSDKSLDESFTLLSQMLFNAQLTVDDLAKEKQIVIEEWRTKQGVATRMNLQRTVSIRVDSRYARGSVLGTKQDIQRISHITLQQFYQQWYVPNNMTLLVIGDVQPQQVIAKIQQYFSSTPAQSLPTRDYYEPKLSNKLRIHQLQDKQSGVSQIAYIWRFDESQSRGDSQQARYQRLVDRLTLALLNQRLRQQQKQLAKGINSIVVRKADIGKNTVALGIFAGVDKQSHHQGLTQILEEIERLKQYPFSQAEFDTQKAVIKEQIDFAQQNKKQRDFAQWVQVMNNTLLMGKPYLPQVEIARLTEPLLAQIQLTDVQQRLAQWFSATDRIVQFQLPHNETGFSLTAIEVDTLIQQIAKTKLTPPEQAQSVEPMQLATLTATGKITAKQPFPLQNVVHWQLANGDKVVWLKTALAGENSYFQAKSQAGFEADSLLNWQSQLASQLIAQTAPLNWQIEQLNQWKKERNIALSLNQTAHALVFSGQTKNTHFTDLLRLFYALQRETQINEESIEEIQDSVTQQMQKRADNSNQQQLSEKIEILKYGKKISDGYLPTDLADLQQLNAQQLNQQWQLMTDSPMTYYIVNNLSEQEMSPLISTYLASIPRGKTLSVAPRLAQAGKQEETLYLGEQNKQDISIWWYHPYQWRGQDAMLISLLQDITSQKLKLALRDQQLGIYSLGFTSRLNPQTQQIESELTFTASPDKSEKLIQQAKAIYQQMATLIDEQDVEQAKALFLQQETNRLNQVSTWINRLILSEEQYADPRYLSEMASLSESITLANLQEVARHFNNDNVKILTVRP